MIDKQLLTEIGFKKETDYFPGHEVWTYDWIFFVHYGGPPPANTGRDISGDNVSLKDFFSSFIRAIRRDTREDNI